MGAQGIGEGVVRSDVSEVSAVDHAGVAERVGVVMVDVTDGGQITGARKQGVEAEEHLCAVIKRP